MRIAPTFVVVAGLIFALAGGSHAAAPPAVAFAGANAPALALDRGHRNVPPALRDPAVSRDAAASAPAFALLSANESTSPRGVAALDGSAVTEPYGFSLRRAHDARGPPESNDD